MAFAFNGTTSKMVLGTAPFSGVPFTMACFTKVTTVAQKAIMQIDDGTDLNRHAITTSSGGAFVAVCTATTSANATTTEVTVANKWYAAAHVSNSVTSRFAVLDGRLSTEVTTSKTPVGLSEFVLGTTITPGFFFTGLLAEVAIWLTALSPNELRRYAEGIPASQISPSSLLLYMPLTVQHGTRDLGPRSLILTNTACVPVSDHPSIMRPIKRPLRRSRLVFAH